MSILFVTILGQIVIVQFGSIVFSLDPNGLSVVNWLICLAVGSGSLVVGFLIRLLPEFEVPVWLLGGVSEVVNQPTIVNARLDKEETLHKDIPLEIMPTGASERWKGAINKTKTQVRVVKMFAVPGSATAPSPRLAEPKSSSTGVDTWKTLRQYVTTTNAFRSGRRAHASSTQLTDPRLIRNAKVELARSRSIPKMV